MKLSIDSYAIKTHTHTAHSVVYIPSNVNCVHPLLSFAVTTTTLTHRARKMRAPNIPVLNELRLFFDLQKV